MASLPTALPRVTIQFCTQCKWLLRAAYFAQELLSTFGTALGEVALQPSTGGTFVVEIYNASLSTDPSSDSEVNIQKHVLWDRKAEGGFPETKELKRRVRDIIDPGRDLGHVDGKKKSVANAETPAIETLAIGQAKQPEEENERPPALRLLREQNGERKFTPMDVDSGETKTQTTGDGLKRSPDGSICEDCN